MSQVYYSVVNGRVMFRETIQCRLTSNDSKKSREDRNEKDICQYNTCLYKSAAFNG